MSCGKIKRIEIVETNKDEAPPIQIDKNRLLKNMYTIILGKRTAGELEGAAYWLDTHFDWIIVKDSTSTTCLVPLKKS